MSEDICYRCQYSRSVHAVVKSLTEDGGALTMICPTSLFSEWDKMGHNGEAQDMNLDKYEERHRKRGGAESERIIALIACVRAADAVRECGVCDCVKRSSQPWQNVLAYDAARAKLGEL